MKRIMVLFGATLISCTISLTVFAQDCSETADKCYVVCDTKFFDDGYKRRTCRQKCLEEKLDCQSKAGSKKLKNLTDKGAKKVEGFIKGLKD